MKPTAAAILRAAPALALAGLIGAPLGAQIDRYELGLRVRRFERALAAAPDAARKPGFAAMLRAVPAFFRLDLRGVASELAAGTFALAGVEPAPDQVWADALQLSGPQLADAAAECAWQLELAFPPRARPAAGADSDDDETEPVPLPGGLTVELWLDDAERPAVAAPLTAVPLRIALPPGCGKPGDHRLCWRVRQGDRTLALREQGISLAADLDARLRAVAAAAADADAEDGIEHATLGLLAQQLRAMARARAETVLPGARLLAEAEALAALPAGARYYGDERPGEYWLRVPAAEDAVVRFVAPPAGRRPAADQPAADRPAPRPIVVALHGAGGSENLFCDAYGCGAIVRLCAERGWYLAAPRSQGLLGVSVPQLVDALAARWAIDRQRVFAVGHSMGAMQLVAASAAAPARYRAVAALSGGRLPRMTDGVRLLPFFVGAGGSDFGRDASAGLAAALQKGGGDVTLREYPGVDHFSVVQIALPDVFAFFDRHRE